jgi:hypothetical protein
MWPWLRPSGNLGGTRYLLTEVEGLILIHRLFVPDAGHDFMLEPAGIDVAIRINHWLLSVLPDEGLQLSKA